MFLEQQIRILEWCLKDHDTEDWSNAAENQLCHHINYIKKKKNTKFILNCNIFHYITFLL